MLCTPKPFNEDQAELLTAASDPDGGDDVFDEKEDEKDEKVEEVFYTSKKQMWKPHGKRVHRIRSIGDPSYKDRYSRNTHRRLKAFSEDLTQCASSWNWRDLKINCTGATNNGKHTEYILTVFHPDAVWRIYRRFSEFVKLHKECGIKRPKRPPRTLFKASAKTVQERQEALPNYLNRTILRHRRAIFLKRGFIDFLTADMDIMFEYVISDCKLRSVKGRYLYTHSLPDEEEVPRAVYQNQDHPDTTLCWDNKYGWCCKKRRKVLLIAEENYEDGQFPPGGKWDNPSGGPRERPYTVQKVLPDKRKTQNKVHVNLLKQINARLGGLKVETRFGPGVIKSVRRDEHIVVKLGYGIGYLKKDAVQLPNELTPHGKLKITNFDGAPWPPGEKPGKLRRPLSDSSDFLRKPQFSLQWSM